MDEGSLYELAESIKAQGVMQPVLVRAASGAGAATRSSPASGASAPPGWPGWTRCRCWCSDVPDEAAAAMALIENIQREDLNPLEEAQGLQRLIDEFGLTHEQAAQAVGRSRSAASNLLRLLNLTRAGAAAADGRRPRHGPRARAAAARRRRSRSCAANEIVAKKLSVREAEKLVAAQAGAGAPGAAAAREASTSRATLLRIEEDCPTR